MPLKDRIVYHKACMVFKSLNGLAPKYMTDMFRYTHDTHSRDTRTAARKDLALPAGKHKDIFMRTLTYDGAKIWNNMPIHVREATTLQSFRSRYLKDYFSKL